MTTPRDVIFSAMRPRGFREYLEVHKPRTAAAATLIRHIRADPRFPRELSSAEGLRFWIRHARPMPAHVREAATPLWAGYAAWRRARAKAAQVPATAPGEAADSDLAAAQG